MKIANSYENCKRPCRNYTPKHENSFFAILISVCNFHISLQFSYHFAILTFWLIVPTRTFAVFISVCNSHVFVYRSYVDVCNFHMSLQFSYEFAIFISVCNSHVTTPALTYIALPGFYVTMTQNSFNPRQPWFSVEDKDKNQS